MDAIITPSKMSGSVKIPPSKSLSHRAIIAASLASGESIISNVVISEDIEATIYAMKALGADIEVNGDTLKIKGSKPKRVSDIIDCHESGSTIRFMIPIALTVDEKIKFIGKNKLVKRPLDSYFEIFDKQNIKYERNEDYLPLTVYSGLKPDTYEIRGDISSQFITGLLFALPLLKGDSKIVVTTPLESIGYVDLTLDVLKLFGIEIINNNYKEFIVKGNQEYKPSNYTVEGDFSQSAFYLLANMLGHDIKLLNMNKDSSQGDKKIIKDIEAFGGKCEFEDTTLTCKKVNLKGANISFSQSPDLGPALSCLASVAKGESLFFDVARLRIKECDRVTDMLTELNKMGAITSETENSMKFIGVNELHGATLDSHNDHRVCMSLAILASVAKGETTILNASCIKKSYPHFFDDFISLGGKVRYV